MSPLPPRSQRWDKTTNGPGLPATEQAKPTSPGVHGAPARPAHRDTQLPGGPALGEERPVSWRQGSHTSIKTVPVCRCFHSLAAFALLRPESGPKFSGQNKTIVFSRKMGGAGWRAQPLAWRPAQLATPAAKPRPPSGEQNRTATAPLPAGSPAQEADFKFLYKNMGTEKRLEGNRPKC